MDPPNLTIMMLDLAPEMIFNRILEPAMFKGGSKISGAPFTIGVFGTVNQGKSELTARLVDYAQNETGASVVSTSDYSRLKDLPAAQYCIIHHLTEALDRKDIDLMNSRLQRVIGRPLDLAVAVVNPNLTRYSRNSIMAYDFLVLNPHSKEKKDPHLI